MPEELHFKLDKIAEALNAIQIDGARINAKVDALEEKIDLKVGALDKKVDKLDQTWAEKYDSLLQRETERFGDLAKGIARVNKKATAGWKLSIGVTAVVSAVSFTAVIFGIIEGLHIGGH